MMNLILLFKLAHCLILLWVAAMLRADKEALVIQGSTIALGRSWHFRMWVTGKAPAGFVAVLFFVAGFPGVQSKLLAAVPMGFLSAVWYWFWFDQFLSLERGRDRWYISCAKQTALSDKVLRAIRDASSLSDRQTHLVVKIPMLLIGAVGCLAVIILN